MTKEEEIAVEMYNKGKQWSCSTSIDEDTILMGYGELDYNDFELPLPKDIIIKEFGTTSWDKHLKARGLR